MCCTIEGGKPIEVDPRATAGRNSSLMKREPATRAMKKAAVQLLCLTSEIENLILFL